MLPWPCSWRTFFCCFCFFCRCCGVFLTAYCCRRVRLAACAHAALFFFIVRRQFRSRAAKAVALGEELVRHLSVAAFRSLH